ncbi:MAG TPA: DUF6492 family protein [Candidatus Baltobacteraceae bacterium]|jgi:hypothetical protein
MYSEQIAIVTPSFKRDLELCRALNRSVQEFLPEAVRHYIVVDRRDLRNFLPLSSRRTIVLCKEDVLPKSIIQLPRMNRWLTTATVLPISGWLVQQIAKIAMASLLSESTLLMVDSDAVFVRDVEPSIFARDGKTRLYCNRDGITPDMTAHIAWHRNACVLLGLPKQTLPLDDYIGQVISWKRELVLRMCERLEQVSGHRWYDAIARIRQFSEYLLYGIFIQRVLGTEGNVWIDERARCNSHWATSKLSETDITDFVGSLEADELALMISAHSGTTHDTRAAAISLATNGRL